MKSTEVQPERVLAVFLGASMYEKAPKLADGSAFYHSAKDFYDYLRHDFGVPRQNIKWLFDDSRSPSDQLDDVASFLSDLTNQLNAQGRPAENVIVHYVGHGLFSYEQYCLAIRTTKENSEGMSSIRGTDLATVIKENGRFLRRYLILDCCFAAAIYREFQFQSPPMTIARVQVTKELPKKGTSLLCSSNGDDPSFVSSKLGRTMFSDALIKALKVGHPSFGDGISFSELGDLVKYNLKTQYSGEWARPEVHSPDQREGDIADLPLFPNPAHAQQVQEEPAESSRLEQGKQEQAERARLERELGDARRKEAEQEAAERKETEKKPGGSNIDLTYYSPQRIAERASEAAKKARELEQQKQEQAKRARLEQEILEEAERARRLQELEEARRKKAEQDAAEKTKPAVKRSSSNYDPTYYSPQCIAERAAEAAKKARELEHQKQEQAERDRLAQEMQAQAERDRLEREKQAEVEQERLEREKQDRDQDEQKRLEQEKNEKAKARFQQVRKVADQKSEREKQERADQERSKREKKTQPSAQRRRLARKGQAQAEQERQKVDAQKTPTAFFSYDPDDSAFAVRLAQDLKGAGANVWIDQLDIQPGEEWESAIETAVTQSPRMLLILSPASVRSQNVKDEISFAIEEKKTIIPILHRDCTVPLQLRRIQYIDLKTDYSRGVNVLLKTLGVPSVQSNDLLTGPLTISAVLKGPELRIVGDAYPTGDNGVHFVFSLFNSNTFDFLVNELDVEVLAYAPLKLNHLLHGVGATDVRRSFRATIRPEPGSYVASYIHGGRQSEFVTIPPGKSEGFDVEFSTRTEGLYDVRLRVHGGSAGKRLDVPLDSTKRTVAFFDRGAGYMVDRGGGRMLTYDEYSLEMKSWGLSDY